MHCSNTHFLAFGKVRHKPVMVGFVCLYYNTLLCNLAFRFVLSQSIKKYELDLLVKINQVDWGELLT
jgi:hypothetical protein